MIHLTVRYRTNIVIRNEDRRNQTCDSELVWVGGIMNRQLLEN
jgi:hypothetical protein